MAEAQMLLGSHQSKVEKKLDQWRKENTISRIWNKDPSAWNQRPDAKELSDRLGWLHLPDSMLSQIDDIRTFAQEIKSEGFQHAVLLGMGGSSLAPEVFQETFGNAPGFPQLKVLDSTHPSAIADMTRSINPAATVFIVSSKSGTTLETLTLFYYFWDLLQKTTGEPGRNIIAITDPGTPLQKTAADRRFRRTFLAPPDVGGRYSALSVFGIVPAALIGVDVKRLMESAGQMAAACALNTDPGQNPGAILGAALGELGSAGIDKLTFVPDPEIAAFPLWLEQLIAESTGKENKGLIPIAGEIAGSPQAYGRDRLFIRLAMERSGERHGQPRPDPLQQLQADGHPVIHILFSEPAMLGREFFRWEFAVAAAGAVLGIHPFDQPDVQLAKDLARKAMESRGKGAGGGEPAPGLSRKTELLFAVNRWLKSHRPHDYIAIQAYLNPEPKTAAGIEKLRNALRDRLRAATTVGVGPRFLHSTGQLHKGGPENGMFLQLVDRPVEDIPVPGQGYTFGNLIEAQAEGDYQALLSRNRRVLKIDLSENPAAAANELANLFESALEESPHG